MGLEGLIVTPLTASGQLSALRGSAQPSDSLRERQLKSAEELLPVSVGLAEAEVLVEAEMEGDAVGGEEGEAGEVAVAVDEAIADSVEGSELLGEICNLRARSGSMEEVPVRVVRSANNQSSILDILDQVCGVVARTNDTGVR